MESSDVLTSTLTPQNGTNIVVEKEMKIETVIVILWATGGVLLLILMVLLACILKNNKKGRSQRSSVFGITDSCVGTRHGGVNPGFSNYDEIWTWIPVVRGNQDECQGASAPEVATTQSSASVSNTLSRSLEPPPYSVAISTPSYPPSTRYTTAPSTSDVQSQTNSVSTEINITSSIVTTAAITRPVVSSSEAVSQSVYAERLRESSHNLLRRTHENNRRERQSPVTGTSSSSRNESDRVYRLKSSSSSNGGGVGNGINENVRFHRDDVIPPRNDVTNAKHQNERVNYRDVRSPRPSRSRNTRRCLIPENEEVRSSSEETYPTGSESPLVAHASRSSREFSYDAEAGLYSFSTGTNGRRVWCDIPPSLMDEEGPPPYTPPPDYPGSHPNHPNRSRSREERTAPIVRLAKRPAVLDIQPIYSRDGQHGKSFVTRGLNTTIFDEHCLLVSRV